MGQDSRDSLSSLGVAVRIGVAVVAIGLVSACGSSGSSSTPTQQSKATGSTTTTVAAGNGSVDLTVSGDAALVLKGKKVTCDAPAGRPEFTLAGADYPPLSQGELQVRQASSAAGSSTLFVAIKSGHYATDDPQPPSAVTVSGKTWTITDLGARNIGGQAILVSGKVVCP